jgi:ribokinase
VRAPDVIVVGSVNTDLVVSVERLPGPGETVTGGAFERHGGGKGANQAVAAARAGASVAFVGAVGDDDLGSEALALLEREGIDVSGVRRLPDAPTGVAAIVVDARGENQIAVASGANARVAGADVARALDGRTAPRGVVLSNLEVPDEAVLAAADAAASAGMTMVLNPAPARPLDDEVLRRGPVLTPNEGEATALSGEEDAGRAARALGERTGAPVVVTLGARGALLVDGGRATVLDAYRVDAVDTTGAGDAFNGVLGARLARGLSLDEALPYALAGAALAVTVAGAREGMASSDRIDAVVARGSSDGGA